MRESEIEKYLVDQVKLRGGEVRKVAWIGRSGAPDRLVMHPRLRAWVELKASGKHATEAQQREHKRMRDMGETVMVFNSIESIDVWLSFHATPTKGLAHFEKTKQGMKFKGGILLGRLCDIPTVKK